MLELVCDHRRGDRLEIVIPTLNEERRLCNLIACYGDAFDLVLLDGGSKDQTCAIADKAGVTVYKRVPGAAPLAESYFAHYNDAVTRSGFCFYLYTDEFVEKADLERAWDALRTRTTVVHGRRVDWLYGKRRRTDGGVRPRGFRQSTAVIHPLEVHNALGHTGEHEQKTPQLVIDVHHLQIYGMKDYFSRAGLYAFWEVENFRKQGHSLGRVARRYLVSEVLLLPRKLWRERRCGAPLLLWQAALSIAIACIGILCWLEQRFLLSPEEQLDRYDQFYTNEPA